MDRPKVIATDLDGTVLDNEGQLSQRSQKALLAARERGILVVAVTARPPRAVARRPELVGAVDAAICVNGAINYDPLTRTAELRHTIPIRTAQRLYEHLHAVLPRAAFAIETGERVVAQARHFRPGVHFAGPWTAVGSAAELFRRVDTVVEMAVYDPASDSIRMFEAARTIDEPDVVMWRWSGHPLLEFNASGASKGHALAEWCRERGIGPESVVAFGDMPNDVSMLAWANRSYAVDGAQPEALGVATHRTASNDEDGVALAVEAILRRFPAPD